MLFIRIGSRFLVTSDIEFDDYGVFITEFEFAYRIRQKYILVTKKIITNAKWPLLKLKYRKGFPNLFGTTSDFDFVEFE